MIKIIHVSDLHLESECPSYAKVNIIKAFANDIKTFVDDATVLLFTGDLINKGGFAFKDKKNAFKAFEDIFINTILSINPCLEGRIFIVPGNHDVFRNEIDPITEAGLKTSLKDIKSLNSFIDTNKKESKHLDRLAAYKSWESNFYSTYKDAELSNFENTFIIDAGEHKIGITTLNSSWLCKDDSDKENILLGQSQIECSLVKIKDCPIKLALSHHPMEYFMDFDREPSKKMLFKEYDVYFTGHVHSLASSYTQDLYGNIFISIANSTIGDFPEERKLVNGYTILNLYPNEKIHACYRKYVEEHQVFVPNTDIGTEDGCKDFKTLKDDKLEKFAKNESIVQALENKYCEKLNEHLIISHNSTKVNCSIDSLFVEPSISNFPENSVKEDEKINYTIEEILESDSNYLIYGLKESGKTILIDKMFIDSVRRFNQFNKIPVLLKFSDFKKEEATKTLREFLSIPSSEIDTFLKSNKVIIFIDDILFTDKSKKQIDSVQALIKKYPTIQIVATTDQILENVIPTEYIDYNDAFNFDVAFIQNFNSSEIRQLILKWFSGREVDLQENMQKLIKSFVDFGLPKTPLTITMFLWIFEKQEKTPINNSVLVEMFVENILEKTNIENIYSETFDFKNKQRFLSFIAKYMRDKGVEDLSYSVDYVELLGFSKEYLKTRFSGQPQKVLDDLIRRGVLTYEDDNLIRFKSAFFFHYFLALHLDYDSKFKAHVFTGENYLNYAEEINYYTGLKRDDLDVLLFTQERLNEAFGLFNADIKENFKKVDTVLEAKQAKDAVTFQIDEKLAQNKLSEKQVDEMYDESLSQIPVQSNITKKTIALSTKQNIDLVLKLACNVLKNSEDVDDFNAKKLAFDNTLTSSISFLMQYRDALIINYLRFKKRPQNLPKNMDFNLLIKVLPLIHQVVIFNWLGSQKLRPVITDKLEQNKLTLNISELEKFMTIFIYGDIKGSDYPEIIKAFIKQTKHNYVKDLSFLKLLSYYHLRNNGKKLDDFYLKLMAELKQELGRLDKNKKSEFIRELEQKKKGL